MIVVHLPLQTLWNSRPHTARGYLFWPHSLVCGHRLALQSSTRAETVRPMGLRSRPVIGHSDSARLRSYAHDRREDP